MRQLSVDKFPVASVAFSPDGTTLASVALGRKRVSAVRLWSLAAEAVLSTHSFETAIQLPRLAFSPTGKSLAVAHGALHFIDLEEGKAKLLANPKGLGYAHLTTCSFSSDGSQLIALGLKMRCWSVPALKEMAVPKFEIHKRAWHYARWNGLARCPKCVIVGMSDEPGSASAPLSWNINYLFFLNPGSSKPSRTIKWDAAKGVINSLAIDQSGKLVAVASRTGTFVWQTEPQGLLAHIRHRPPGPPAVGFTPNGEYLVVLSRDEVQFYAVGHYDKPVKTLNWKVGKLLSLDISPDGSMAAVGSEKGIIVLFDLE